MEKKKIILFCTLIFFLLTIFSRNEVKGEEGQIIINNKSSISFKIYLDGIFAGIVQPYSTLKLEAGKGTHKIRCEGEGRIEERDLNIFSGSAQYTIQPEPPFHMEKIEYMKEKGIVEAKNKAGFEMDVYLKGKGKIGTIGREEEKTVYLEPGLYEFEFRKGEEIIFRKTLRVKKGKKYKLEIK